MKNKYRALRTIKWIIRVVGILWLIAGIAIGIFFMVTPSATIDYTTADIKFNGPPAVGAGVASIVTSIVIMIVLLGFAELLQVLMDTEENTRLTGALLKQMIRNQGKTAQATSPIRNDARNLLETDDMPEF